MTVVRSFKSLLDKAFYVEEETAVAHDLEVAAAALLIDVARADFDCSADELREVAAELEDCFGMGSEEARRMIERASRDHDAQGSLYPFVKVINDRCTPQQKASLVEGLWRVAYTDRRIDKYEEHQIRKIAELLYVSHSEFIRNKLRVIGESQNSG